MSQWQTVVAVAIGGALGALARVGLTGLVGAEAVHLGTLAITLLINVVGAALLATLRLTAHTLPAWLVAGLGVGVLGSFTTWSAVIAASWLLTGAGNPLLGGGYLVTTLALGVAAAGLVGKRTPDR